MACTIDPIPPVVALALLCLGASVAFAGSLETQSNPVAPGGITVIPGNNDRSDWDPIPSFPSDGVDSPLPSLSYESVEVAHDVDNFYFHFLMDNFNPVDPTHFFGFKHHIYFDTDRDRGTGFYGNGGFLSIGADYLLEGPQLWVFSGATQQDYTWTPIPGYGINQEYDDFPMSNIEVMVPRMLMGDPEEFDFFLNAVETPGTDEDYYPNAASSGIVGDYFTYTTMLPLLPGDADGDGDVDLDDYNILSGNMYSAVAGGAADGDFDNNGYVEFEDFVTLALHFGDTVAGEEPEGESPEPGALAVMAAGVIILSGRRRGYT